MIFALLLVLLETGLLNSNAIGFFVKTTDEPVNIALRQASTPAVSRPDPGIKAIDALLKKFEVDGARRKRVAEAIVRSSCRHNLDPRLVASIMPLEKPRQPIRDFLQRRLRHHANTRSNVGSHNLMLHLNGNVRQWLVSSFKRLEDTRDRPAEFRERQWIPASALLEKLGTTLNEASDVLASLTDADLLRTFNIQGYTVNGLQAVYQVVEPFRVHYGQILYVTKLLRGEDLGFYRELDGTGRRMANPAQMM